MEGQKVLVTWHSHSLTQSDAAARRAAANRKPRKRALHKEQKAGSLTGKRQKENVKAEQGRSQSKMRSNVSHEYEEHLAVSERVRDVYLLG